MYEEQDLKLVGSRIKAVRISRGMSQADLAVESRALRQNTALS